MSSPFPGMDPYLEDPAFWPDFHSTFINYCAKPSPMFCRRTMKRGSGSDSTSSSSRLSRTSRSFIVPNDDW
ncbi:MAG: DUF4058 family protein [Planctomycetes bacterium]|nr:DUF4058 family protein [Planctomycetota bacterium]